MSPADHQLTFDLGQRTALGREDFLVAPCNEDAVRWVDLWPDWPSPAVAICGPKGSGKSHLAAVWRERSAALQADPGTLGDALGAIGPDRRHWLIDPVDRVDDEPALLHFFNRIVDAGGTLLLTADAPPARWTVRLPDLASRLRAAPVGEIGLPDDALLAAVMVKQFADRQLRVPPEVVSYLVPRIERSFQALTTLVDRLDSAALARGRAITVPFVRDILDGT